MVYVTQQVTGIKRTGGAGAAGNGAVGHVGGGRTPS